eukprot:1718676-Prymnesium_polylepis.1
MAAAVEAAATEKAEAATAAGAGGDGAEAEEAEEMEASQEWWFHLDKHDNIIGPLSPSEMRRLYMDGRLGHSTMVRWLPVAYSRPEAAAQP